MKAAPPVVEMAPGKVSADRPAEGQKAARLRRRILVVEDNLDYVHTLTFLLREQGHEVEYAINGYVAVDLAMRFRPDIILLDLGLPGLDGYDVCTRLKSASAFEKTRVIAITADGSDAAKARSRRAGCDLHLVKPVNPRSLFAMLES